MELISLTKSETGVVSIEYTTGLFFKRVKKDYLRKGLRGWFFLKDGEAIPCLVDKCIDFIVSQVENGQTFKLKI